MGSNDSKEEEGDVGFVGDVTLLHSSDKGGHGGTITTSAKEGEGRGNDTAVSPSGGELRKGSKDGDVPPAARVKGCVQAAAGGKGGEKGKGRVQQVLQPHLEKKEERTGRG